VPPGVQESGRGTSLLAHRSQRGFYARKIADQRLWRMGNDDAGWQNKLISSEVQRDSRNTQYRK